MKSNTYIIALTFAAAAVFALPVSAQGYPAKPVRMIIPFSAGGAADVPGRIVTQKLAEVLRQQVVVENRPGAGSTIGADLAAKAAPDGYTVFMISNTHFVSAALHKKLAYDSLNDFTPVTQITSAPNVMVVHPSLPAKSVAELVQLAKSKPGDIRFASGGVSGASHLGSELFRVIAGVNMVHVPYKGTGPGTTALLTGEVQMVIAGVGTLMPHAKSGKVRALAVTGAKRSPAAPELPTVAENGLPGYAFDVWYGVFASSKTPRATLQKINADANTALRDAETAKRFAGAGIDLIGGGLDESNQYLRAEMTKWAKVIREAGITAD